MDKMIEIVEKNVFDNNEIFMKCGNCGKIYWKGSHYYNIKDWIKKTVIL